MVFTRVDDVWMRRGFTLLWGLKTLAHVAQPSQVVSVREFFAMVNDWPEDLPASCGDALVVSGFEGCLDVLSGQDAERWIENDLKEAILSFQDEYEGQAGLIFWVPSGRNRISMKGVSEEYYWQHNASGSVWGLHIGRLLWSGAENEVERLLDSEDSAADYDSKGWVGLHHPRIS
ncbi:MAG: hypothetical protein U9R17_14925 [Thermodesulfobacteriota bacterium]|nr:hypothetical protein [Thermodesulfobacteriota bacterium]